MELLSVKMSIIIMGLWRWKEKDTCSAAIDASLFFLFPPVNACTLMLSQDMMLHLSFLALNSFCSLPLVDLDFDRFVRVSQHGRLNH